MSTSVWDWTVVERAWRRHAFPQLVFSDQSQNTCFDTSSTRDQRPTVQNVSPGHWRMTGQKVKLRRQIRNDMAAWSCAHCGGQVYERKLNDCFLHRVQYRHISQYLIVKMDRWPSFVRFGSRTLQRFHRYLKEWRQLTSARTRRAMWALVCEGSATQLTLLNHLHVAVFILILLVKYTRPLERLTLRRKILCLRMCHFSYVGRSCPKLSKLECPPK